MGVLEEMRCEIDRLREQVAELREGLVLSELRHVWPFSRAESAAYSARMPQFRFPGNWVVTVTRNERKMGPGHFDVTYGFLLNGQRMTFSWGSSGTTDPAEKVHLENLLSAALALVWPQEIADVPAHR
jgi:hypothetical protein